MIFIDFSGMITVEMDEGVYGTIEMNQEPGSDIDGNLAKAVLTALGVTEEQFDLGCPSRTVKAHVRIEIDNDPEGDKCLLDKILEEK